MPKYTAELYRNTREVLYHDFEAEDDAAARKYITEGTESYDIEWIDREDSDAVCDATDKVIHLQRFTPGLALAEGDFEDIEEAIELKSEMPYARASRAFAQRIAAIGPVADPEATLRHLIEEARKLCGMEG